MLSSASRGSAAARGGYADRDGKTELERRLEEEIRRIDIAEVFSPPRVTEIAKEFGLKPGDAMDLTTGWNFSNPEHQKKAEDLIEQRKPQLLIGSPMCRMYSALQNLTPWTDKKQR